MLKLPRLVKVMAVIAGLVLAGCSRPNGSTLAGADADADTLQLLDHMQSVLTEPAFQAMFKTFTADTSSGSYIGLLATATSGLAATQTAALTNALSIFQKSHMSLGDLFHKFNLAPNSITVQDVDHMQMLGGAFKQNQGVAANSETFVRVLYVAVNLHLIETARSSTSAAFNLKPVQGIPGLDAAYWSSGYTENTQFTNGARQAIIGLTSDGSVSLTCIGGGGATDGQPQYLQSGQQGRLTCDLGSDANGDAMKAAVVAGKPGGYTPGDCTMDRAWNPATLGSGGVSVQNGVSQNAMGGAPTAPQPSTMPASCVYGM